MTNIRRSLMGLLATGATLLLLTLGAAPAHAAGYSYDGTLPNTAAGGYCATGSSQITPDYPIKVGGTGATVGYVNVRYSPSCGTNWVTMYTSLTGYTQAKGIDRASPIYFHYEQDPGAGSTFSPQVYAPGSTCISISGELWNSSGTYATSGWIYVC